jgi:siroheme synthase
LSDFPTIVYRTPGPHFGEFGKTYESIGVADAAELAAAGVPFEIVPGISSTIGGPAYAGIPVTHRDHNTQLTIFTGHEDPTKGFSSIDYAQLAKAPGTKVFVMGVARLRPGQEPAGLLKAADVARSVSISRRRPSISVTA